MNGWFSGWRVALRIARRDALRHRARSILILAMVGLPVLGLTTADVLARTMQLSPDQTVTRQIGAATDQLIPPADQAPTPVDGSAVAVRAVTAAGVAAALPTGTRIAVIGSGSVVDRRAGGLEQLQTLEADMTSPVLRGIWRLRSGRLPTLGDQVALTTHAARALHVRAGDRLTLADPARTVTVAGLVVVPDSLSEDLLIARPGALLPAGSIQPGQGLVAANYHDPVVLAVRPAGMGAAAFAAAVGHAGFGTETRSALAHPPSSALVRSQPFDIAVVAVGLGILQVVLLAGAAFAVGARRQVRDLALLGASGGDRRQVRAVVLGSGIVLGAAAGVAGVGLGIPLGLALVPLVERLGQRLSGGFDLRPAELLLGTVIGVVAGLLAASLPARTAGRQDVVQALSGRRGVRGTPRSLTLAGLAAVIAGGLLTGRGARPPADADLVLAGAALAELGFVACAPAVIGAVARLARFAPVAGRMALRDAARNRARSGPAVAAVMAALAGAVAISTYLVSSDAHDRSTYQGQARVGQVVVYDDGTGTGDSADGPGVHQAAALLPTRAVVVMTQLYELCDPAHLAGSQQGPATPAAQVCPTVTPEQSFSGPGEETNSNVVALGDAATLRALIGRDDAAGDAALAAGRAVVLARTALGTGAGGPVVRLLDASRTDINAAAGPDIVLPAVFVDTGLRNLPYTYPDVLLPPGVIAAEHYGVRPTGLLIDTTRTPTRDEAAQAQAALSSAGSSRTLEVERGYQGRADVVQLSLTAVAVLVTIGATAIATGLAAAEGRADLATLAAVGASPGLRRRLAMSEAAVVAVLGAGLGVLSGLVPAVAVVHARTGWPLQLPWTALGVAVVGVPLLAALLAGLVTRSRLPLVARST